METVQPPAKPTDPAGPSSPIDRRTQLLRRGLFPYFDGVRDRLGDILVIQMRMQKALPQGDMDHLDALLKAAAGGQEPDDAVDDQAEASTPAGAAPPPPPVASTPPALTSFEAMVELGRVVGLAFDLAPFDETTGSGLSTQERADLIGDFLSAGVEAEGDDQAGPDPAVDPPPAESGRFSSQLDVPTAHTPAQPGAAE